MKKLFFLLSMLTVTFNGMAQTVEEKPDVSGQTSESLAAVKLANQVLRYGYENKSTLALLDALQIFSENPTQPFNATKQGDAVDETKNEGKKADVSFDYESVLADAKKFADGDQNLLALIDNIDAEAKGAQRGNVNGPSRDYAAVNGKSYIDYTASFVANQLAEVLVSGDGDTDLDLYVYDSNGNLITRDDDYSDDCYVRWIPAWTGRYTIRIVNRGPVYNRFVILTN
jgi:hypothetical protein